MGKAASRERNIRIGDGRAAWPEILSRRRTKGTLEAIAAAGVEGPRLPDAAMDMSTSGELEQRRIRRELPRRPRLEAAPKFGLEVPSPDPDMEARDVTRSLPNGTQNFAYIKPAKASAQTNLNLITASGNIYSFVVAEVSEQADGAPDLKVFVEPKEESMLSAANAAPKFVSAQVVDDYRQQVTLAKEETRQVKQAAQAEIDRGVSKFLSNVRFPYRFEAGKKPFFVRAIYNDEKFTYIQARPEETPALYEIQDGKPNLVNFDYRNGVYVVEKILDRGYLVIGKQKLNFTRVQ